MKKIIGWFLLALGVLTITYSGWSSFEIFTGKKPASEIFKTQEPQEETLGKTTSGTSPQEQASQQLQQTIKEQLEKMLPPDFLPKIMNLMSWSILAGILIFAGGKIAGLGIKLLK